MADQTTTNAAAALEEWRHDGETITQQAIAIELGAAVRTAARWCSGESAPTLAQARQLERLRPGLVRRLFPEAFTAEG